MYVERNYFTFKSTAAYLGTGENRKALRIINAYINAADRELKQDSYAFAMILNLLIHFELDNSDLLEYTLKSTHRYLKSRKRLFEFEKAMMNFIKDATVAHSTKDLVAHFKKLQKGLIVIKDDKFESAVFEYFDINDWLESKLKNQSLEEVVKKKVMKDKINIRL